jgi:hypothetical protein
VRIHYESYINYSSNFCRIQRPSEVAHLSARLPTKQQHGGLRGQSHDWRGTMETLVLAHHYHMSNFKSKCCHQTEIKLVIS